MTTLLKKLFKIEKRGRERHLQDVKQEVLNRIGREQFEKILKRGLSIPVVTV